MPRVCIAHPPDADVELIRATLSRLAERYPADRFMHTIVWTGMYIVCLLNERILKIGVMP